MLGIIEPVRGGESRTPLANAPTSPDVSVALSEEDSGVSGSRQHVYDLISRFDNTGINKGSLPLPKAASWARSRLASTARTSQSKREEDQVVDVEPVPVFECPKSLADWVKEVRVFLGG